MLMMTILLVEEMRLTLDKYLFLKTLYTNPFFVLFFKTDDGNHGHFSLIYFIVILD